MKKMIAIISGLAIAAILIAGRNAGAQREYELNCNGPLKGAGQATVYTWLGARSLGSEVVELVGEMKDVTNSVRYIDGIDVEWHYTTVFGTPAMMIKATDGGNSNIGFYEIHGNGTLERISFKK